MTKAYEVFCLIPVLFVLLLAKNPGKLLKIVAEYFKEFKRTRING